MLLSQNLPESRPEREKLDRQDDLLAYLRTDPMRHLVMLKLYKQFPGQVDLQGSVDGKDKAVIMKFPTQISHFFSDHYPKTKYVVLPIATKATLLAPYYAELIKQTPILMVIPDEAILSETEKYFDLAFRRGNLSYTLSKSRLDNYQSVPAVEQVQGIAETAKTFFFQNGYSAEELGQLESWGAETFLYIQNNVPVAACFIFPNQDNIWEIAGVRTLEEYRGRGYAKQLVKTAAKYILDQGYALRYQMESENVASKHLAESLGMQLFLDLKHYVATQKN